jgi:predicted RNA-binding Zn-ribbon protein involved in translation (DUF1610 family)
VVEQQLLPGPGFDPNQYFQNLAVQLYVDMPTDGGSGDHDIQTKTANFSDYSLPTIYPEFPDHSFTDFSMDPTISSPSTLFTPDSSPPDTPASEASAAQPQHSPVPPLPVQLAPAIQTSKFPCSHCTKGFSRQCDLTKHMKTHNHPLRCEICGDDWGGAAEMKDLIRHNRVHHSDRIVAKSSTVCPHCNKDFRGRQDNLKRHVRDSCRAARA